MKTFDCFTYFNEEEILKLRLECSADYVDYFVIVEADQTFTGHDKPFYLDNAGSWIEKWKDRIIRVNVSFPADVTSSWDREAFQRNQIFLGLKNAQDHDLVVISDVDEIINFDVFKSIESDTLPVRLDNKQFFWNFHWQAPQHCNQGARPVLCFKKDLFSRSAQELRSSSLTLIPNAGWHFTYFSDEANVKKKIESFAHTEYNSDEYKSLEKIRWRIENGIDPFDRFPLKYMIVDSTYPKFIQENYNG
jgi:beta-1,4-mannosyl-glycoprotein beta-1,4-N-acetylglucosaminyltransferase